MQENIKDSREEEYMLMMLFMSMGMTENQLKIIRDIYIKNKEEDDEFHYHICMN